MFSEEPRRSKIIDEIAEVIKSKTSSEWLEVFRHSDVCITKVNNLEEALNNPHIMQRQLWFMQEYSPEGLIPQMNFPVKFSEKNLGWRTPPPQLGEHTEDVLLSIGYSSKDIEELSKKKVI